MDPNLEFFWPRTSIENYLQLLDCVRDLNDERDDLYDQISKRK